MTRRERLRELDSQMQMAQLTADKRRYDRLREEWAQLTDTTDISARTNQ